MDERTFSAKAGVWLCGVALLGSGCLGESDAAYKARMARLEAEGQALTDAADALEDRLLGNQATLQLWSELHRRHQTVSALACSNQNGHLNAMVSSLERQQEKARKLRRARVTSERGPVASVGEAAGVPMEGPTLTRPGMAQARMLVHP